MTKYYIDYTRLSYLGDRMKAGKASQAEKDEYMLMLYRNGNITEGQYNDYKANRNTEDIIKLALSVGAIILIGYILDQLFSSK